MSGMKSASKKKRGAAAPARKTAARGSAAAAAAEPAPAPAAAAEPVDIAAALECVEEMLEQSDLRAAESALRSPDLLGRLRAADIGAAHAPLVPAMELLAQVLMEKGKTKEAFAVGTRAAHCTPHHSDVSSMRRIHCALVSSGPSLTMHRLATCLCCRICVCPVVARLLHASA